MNYLHPESSTSNSFFALLNFLFTVLMMLITLFVSIFLGGRILIGPGVNYFGSFMSRFFLGKYRQTSTSVNFDLNSPALFETPTEKDIKRVQEMWDDEMKDEALRPNFKLYLISAPFAVVSAIHIWIALGVAQSVDKKYVIFKQTYRFIKGFFN
ncbi:MAG: hypothetical protein GY797_17850 [Deltaproteobacteria bacterium]|nr:hypothetical protein [Deltaproteobacteria bacterium]